MEEVMEMVMEEEKKVSLLDSVDCRLKHIVTSTRFKRAYPGFHGDPDYARSKLSVDRFSGLL